MHTESMNSMKNGTCYIVSAGENYGIDFKVLKNDYVIAADGGYDYLLNSGKTADLIIGDFDSIKILPENGNIITLNKMKDDTDTLSAIRQGLSLGYKVFKIYCGMGGRIEHTLANIQALAFLSENGAKGFLYGKDSILTAFKNTSISFSEKAKGYISVFSMGDKCEGVSLKGFKYPMENGTIENMFPIGVSNEFVGQTSVISVEKGILLVVFPKTAEEFMLP